MAMTFSPRASSGAAVLVFALCPALAVCAELEQPEPIGKPAMKAYRQVMPDGSIVYSDKLVEGAKVDETIKADEPGKGSISVSESPSRPAIPPQTRRTEVNRVASIPVPGGQKTIDEAEADVMRAEMLLEDAKKRQAAGVEARPGERTGNAGGGSRLNAAYKARQRSLAQAVDEAEAVLKKSVATRDALRNPR